MLLRHRTIEHGLSAAGLCAMKTRLLCVNGLLIFFFVVFSSDGKDGETETKDEKGEQSELD